MYEGNKEVLNQWADALLASKQHVFDMNAAVRPYHMKYADGSYTVVGVLAELFKPDWVPYYAPGEAPPIAREARYQPRTVLGRNGLKKKVRKPASLWRSYQYRTEVEKQRTKVKVAGYGAFGSSGPMSDALMKKVDVWPSFLAVLTTRNWKNEPFEDLANFIRSYDPKEWEPKKG